MNSAETEERGKEGERNQLVFLLEFEEVSNILMKGHRVSLDLFLEGIDTTTNCLPILAFGS